jgi:hypothetical protein
MRIVSLDIVEPEPECLDEKEAWFPWEWIG